LPYVDAFSVCLTHVKNEQELITVLFKHDRSGVSLMFPRKPPLGHFSVCFFALSFPCYLLFGHPIKKLIKKEFHLESVQWYVVAFFVSHVVAS